MRRTIIAFVVLLFGQASSGGVPPAANTQAETASLKKDSCRTFGAGSLTIHWKAEGLQRIGAELVWLDKNASDVDLDAAIFELSSASRITVKADADGSVHLEHADIRATGACMMSIAGQRIPFGNPRIEGGESNPWVLFDTLAAERSEAIDFTMESVFWQGLGADAAFQLAGDLILSARWAERLGIAAGRDATIAQVTVSATMESGVVAGDANRRQRPDAQAGDRTAAASRSVGPDVIVGDLQSVLLYGNNAAGIAALAVGTTSCNIGDEWVSWIANTNKHPVIAQSIYRLKEGRFEQLGMSWVKHGFYAISAALCSGPGGCHGDPTGKHLGVGCSDPYSASLNGQPVNMSPRSQLNPHTGVFPYPWTAPTPPPLVGRRIQVPIEDLLPDLNPDADYFVEGQYLTQDDAAAGNQDNNASYRRMLVGGSLGNIFVLITGSTQREQPAIRAWADTDPSVVETDIHVPGEGLFILAAKTTDLGGGLWHYEYAVQNLNSDRAARRFALPIDPGASVTNIGFRDIDHHSGEVIDGTDWASAVVGGVISWSTVTYEVNPDGNALRWGTMYNFWFDADVPPQSSSAAMELFKPGALTHVSGETVGPAHPPPDCNGNGIDDPCDIDCGSAGGGCDLPGCGQSSDLDGNGVPDSCDPDCNGNGLPDGLDIANGTSPDCSGNTVPDECEPDGDSDGIVDECDDCPEDPENDADGDGLCAPDDECPHDPDKIVPGQCGCGNPDTDTDHDFVADCVDNCPFDFNFSQVDTDNDGLGAPCDNCPDTANADQADADSDGAGDVCDPCPQENPDDQDGDGVCAPDDQCPLDGEKTQPGICGCGTADTDSDEDGTADCHDDCPMDPHKVSPGLCGCGVADLDSDSDGVEDCHENCPFDPLKQEPGICGCGVPDVDTDGDTVLDCLDQCPGLDDRIDTDNSGVPDCVERIPAVSTWGAVILTLLLLAAGKIAFGRSARATKP